MITKQSAAVANGDNCEICGEFLGEGNGFPDRCSDCQVDVNLNELAGVPKMKRGRKKKEQQ